MNWIDAVSLDTTRMADYGWLTDDSPIIHPFVIIPVNVPEVIIERAISRYKTEVLSNSLMCRCMNFSVLYTDDAVVESFFPGMICEVLVEAENHAVYKDTNHVPLMSDEKAALIKKVSILLGDFSYVDLQTCLNRARKNLQKRFPEKQVV